MKDGFTEDGYKIIPPFKKSGQEPKGVCCGECGMKFDHGKAYGYSCVRPNCPFMPKTFSL